MVSPTAMTSRSFNVTNISQHDMPGQENQNA